jgi:hypothetical protein
MSSIRAVPPSDFAALPSIAPAISCPPLLLFQFCVSFRMINVGRPPSIARGDAVTASIWRVSPSPHTFSFPTCTP